MAEMNVSLSILISQACWSVALVLVALLAVRGLRLFFAAFSSFAGKNDSEDL